jgi:hypothetical protein
MKRVKAFWVIISVLTALLAVVIVADPALACESCDPEDQYITDTITIDVDAGESCTFTARGSASNPIAASVNVRVTVPGCGSADETEIYGCYDYCGPNTSCILNCQGSCTRFEAEADASLSCTFDTAQTITVTASAGGLCNPRVDLEADCEGT